MIRLDKYLADMGAGTRQEVKKYIRQGQVTVDGQPAKKPDMKVDELCQVVAVSGTRVSYKMYEYYMMNKPKGVVSATSDKKEKTVLDLMEDIKRRDLFPAGRLDKDTEGLLLITNDGALAHRLLSPKKHVDKCYYASVSGIVTDEDVLCLRMRGGRLTRGMRLWRAAGFRAILRRPRPICRSPDSARRRPAWSSTPPWAVLSRALRAPWWALWRPRPSRTQKSRGNTATRMKKLE